MTQHQMQRQQQQHPLARVAESADWQGTIAQLELVKSQVAPDATFDELAYFLSVAKSRGLDPLHKQIYAIHRYDKRKDRKVMAIQTGIDGYRAIADRTGDYCGNDEAVFSEEHNKPVSASVTVWKLVRGVRTPFTAAARFSEYRQDRSPMWSRMPFTMLAKCAEAKALRKAFPAQLSGVYTGAEMHQADDAPVTVTATATVTSRPSLAENQGRRPPAPAGRPTQGEAKAAVDEAKRISPEQLARDTAQHEARRYAKAMEDQPAELERFRAATSVVWNDAETLAKVLEGWCRADNPKDPAPEPEVTHSVPAAEAARDFDLPGE